MPRRKGTPLPLTALVALPLSGRDLRISTMSNGRPITLFRGPLIEVAFRTSPMMLTFALLWGARMRLIKPNDGVWEATEHLPPGLVINSQPRVRRDGRIVLGMSGPDLYEILAPDDNLDWNEVERPELEAASE